MTNYWITKIKQSKVKLTTKTIHDSITEARDNALNGETSYIMDGIGDIYCYYPVRKSSFYPESHFGYDVYKFYAPTTENLNMRRNCYTWDAET